MSDPFSLIHLEDLINEFDARLVRKAFKLVSSESVIEVSLDENGILSGIVLDGGKEYNPSIETRSNQLLMACDCPAQGQGEDICAHVLALLIDWVNFQQAPEEIMNLTQPAGLPETPVQKTTRRLLPQLTPALIRADWQHRLEYLTIKDIRDLAALYQVKLKGSRREDVLQVMLDILCNPAQLAAVIQRLPPDSHRLLDIMCILADLPIFFNPAQFGPNLDQALDNGLKARPLKDLLADLARYKLYQLGMGNGRISIPLGVLALTLLNPTLFKPLAGEDQPGHVVLARPFQFTRLALRLLLLAQSNWLSFNPAPTGKNWPGMNSPVDRRESEIRISAEPPSLSAESLAALESSSLSREQIELAARLNEAAGLWLPARPTESVPRLNEWLHLSAQEQSRQLFEQALGLPSSLEMDLASQAGGFWMMRSASTGVNYSLYLSALAQARLHLARLLARTPAGQWIELESILRTLYGLQPEWLVDFSNRQARSKELNNPIWASLSQPQGTKRQAGADSGRQKAGPHSARVDPQSARVDPQTSRVDPQDYSGWRKTYGLFHQAILVNTFLWLGLLDVGYSSKADSQPVAVRLTRFGEFLLGRQADFPAAPPESQAKPLSLQPNGTMELDPDSAPFELISLLIQIAVPELRNVGETTGVGKKKRIPPSPSSGVRSATPLIKGGKTDLTPLDKGGKGGFLGFPRRFRYRLSDAGLGQAFDAGWTLEQITNQLQAASGAALPAALIGQIQRLWERYGRLQLYEDLALIQFGDDYCLPELLAGTRLSQILLFTFSPRLIAIRPEAAADFLSELQAKGYTPRLEGNLHA